MGSAEEDSVLAGRQGPDDGMERCGDAGPRCCAVGAGGIAERHDMQRPHHNTRDLFQRPITPTFGALKIDSTSMSALPAII